MKPLAPWDHARVVFVVFHLATLVVLSLPQPKSNDEAFAREEARFQWVADALGRDRSEVEQTARSVIVKYRRTRRKIAKPFRLYANVAGTNQSWRMFQTTSRRSALLEVAADSGDGWEVLYRARSADHRWNHLQLDHARFRGWLNRFRKRNGKPLFRDSFSPFIAGRVFTDFPNAKRVRVRMIEERAPGPKRLRRGFVRGEAYWDTVVER